MRILQLPAAVANQIAAGEVIERPASVVKELLENSLDAKADSVDIEVVFGGLNQIKISDNGLGIVGEDLPLALAAHATSKISRLQDLYAITSMGFRGEALASIASISRMTISSRPAGEPHGMMLDNRVRQLTPCARNQGTTVDVRDIFFNIPVRKKFLGSERSEFLAIDTIVRRFALSTPTMAIQLSHNGKVQLNLPSAKDDRTQQTRISRLLGKVFLQQAIYINADHAGMKLYGWVSGREYQRSQNDRLWIYINGRMVKDKLLNHAVKQAYENILHPGRHPSCLLYLTIDPAQVDVNVHPTKHEVRFQQPRLIHDFISTQIRTALHVPKEENYPEAPLNQEACLLRENKEPHFSCLTDNVSSISWLALNAHYVYLTHASNPHLLNALDLFKRYLIMKLTNTALPWKERPLLVSIQYEIDAEFSWLDACQEQLAPIGIRISVEGLRINIYSLPVLLPELEIKSFLRAYTICPDPPDFPQILRSLIASQAFDARYSSTEQQAELLSYMSTLKDQDALLKPLSIEVCQELFDA